MKRKLLPLIALLSLAVSSTQGQSYEPEWRSITQYEIPDWALDAKFGIYAHWGPYSIIGSWEENDTYPTNGNYYTVGYRGVYSSDRSNPQRRAFEARYGKLEDGHGYYDLCRDFKARGFDPKKWAELVDLAGAKYAGMCAVHHDGYLMWSSEVSDLCAGKTGTKRDLLGELFEELDKRGIKRIASFHHARTQSFFNGFAKNLSKDPAYKNLDLFTDEGRSKYWFMCDEDEFHKRELAITNELVNKYHPDVIWFDGGVTTGVKELLAEFLNMGEREGREVCLHNKDRMFGDDFGVYSYERGYLRPHSLLNHPWEDDETASICGSWCWWHGIHYKPYGDIVKRLCHLVSINGGLLLSLNPRPDGSFDPEMIAQLKGVGEWMAQNEEAIDGTRPWKIQGEGNMDELSLRYSWSKQMPDRYATPNVLKFKANDFRFTTKGNTLYALQLVVPRPGSSVAIKSLSNKNVVSSGNEIRSIELLGYGKVEFARTDESCIIKLPMELPNNIVLAYKIEVEGELERVLYQGKR
ncbi:MAG: alpha-L-fucosidase [Rikenellaceae bacterium]